MIPFNQEPLRHCCVYLYMDVLEGVSKLRNRNKVLFIVLGVVLLVSLGANGYYLSQMATDKREAELERGKEIIHFYYDAMLFAGMMRSATEGLLESQTMEQRLSYTYQVGLASQYTDSLPFLIASAEDVVGHSFTHMRYTRQLFFVEIINALGSIAGHNGQLAEDELAYLQTVNELFTMVDGWLQEVSFENDADAIALQVVQGGPWVGIAEKINDLFADSPETAEYLFTYRAAMENAE